MVFWEKARKDTMKAIMGSTSALRDKFIFDRIWVNQI
jgi:hypothetical protein